MVECSWLKPPEFNNMFDYIANYTDTSVTLITLFVKRKEGVYGKISTSLKSDSC